MMSGGRTCIRRHRLPHRSAGISLDFGAVDHKSIADHKITRLDELMPWRYAAAAA